jgi:hypothetical protein|tara:strand:+ start:925 stop:1134 length:210 start_codon:yes stop_codon:yes gene_type:complete
MIKIKPLGRSSLSFNEINKGKSFIRIPKALLENGGRINTIGEENLENADDLNCIPSFNLRMYGTLISNQ